MSQIENCEVSNAKQAAEVLTEYDTDYQIKIDMCLRQLLDSKDSWDNVFEIEDEIKSKMRKMHRLYTTPKNQISFDCLLFSHIHDLFMPMVHQEFKKSDEWYFNKGLDLADVTAEQLGANPDYVVPLLAAVVELASLDSHQSPLEKMNCLSTTYDLIFAELKAGIISTISKSSSQEYQIPIINNSDVIPILITVIIKSKLIHLYSNFYYINTFFEYLNEYNSNFKHVLNEFEVAILKMSGLSKETLKPSTVDVVENMDLCKFITVASDIRKKIRVNEDKMTPLDNHLYSVTELIVASTNQNQLLPH
ncbi:hypothetical protein RN001_012787 [Aquatica leii]|uniref:VPS9 domain-containing protein n=1 Tax=Aquatica leii TaxID=1421715 RepID=A0AAN7Q1Z1_9COLE|nr:hypothetical protein RN001_012787 [Aquatica leii]